MRLNLPYQGVIDRRATYELGVIEIPIPPVFLESPEAPARRGRGCRYGTATGEAGALDHILLVEIGSNYLHPPGDPAPFVRRGPGAPPPGGPFARVPCGRR